MGEERMASPQRRIQVKLLASGRSIVVKAINLESVQQGEQVPASASSAANVTRPAATVSGLQLESVQQSEQAASASLAASVSRPAATVSGLQLEAPAANALRPRLPGTASPGNLLSAFEE